MYWIQEYSLSTFCNPLTVRTERYLIRRKTACFQGVQSEEKKTKSLRHSVFPGGHPSKY